MEKRNSHKKIRKAVCLLLVSVCVMCVIGIIWYLCEKKEEEKMVQEQTEEIRENYTDEIIEEMIPESDEEKANLPIDFDGLQEINPEIYAWIRVPDTNIDYPILQHEDDDQSYYLSRDMYGNSAAAGSIYTEYYNTKDFTDPNTVIYGHNMKNGSMFHNVRYFADADYFAEHEDLYIYMPEKILKYQIINCYEYDDRHLLASFEYSDNEVFDRYLEDIMNPRSMYAMVRQGLNLTTEDRLVTLSTCVANKPDHRRLLQAVLVEEIEAEYRGAENEIED